MATENFSTYKHIESNHVLSITPTMVVYDNHLASTEYAVYKRRPSVVGDFSYDFETSVDFISKLNRNGWLLNIALSSNYRNYICYQQFLYNSHGIGVVFYRRSTYKCRLFYNGNHHIDEYDFGNSSPHLKYYTLARTGNSLSLWIYNDSARDDLLTGLNIILDSVSLYSRIHILGIREFNQPYADYVGYTRDLDLYGLGSSSSSSCSSSSSSSSSSASSSSSSFSSSSSSSSFSRSSSSSSSSSLSSSSSSSSLSSSSSSRSSSSSSISNSSSSSSSILWPAEDTITTSGDCYIDDPEGSYYEGTVSILAGTSAHPSMSYYRACFNFELDIPAGVYISDSYLILTPSANSLTEIAGNIRYEDAVNASLPTDYADFQSRSIQPFLPNWLSVPQFTTDVPINSITLVNAITNLVNKPGYNKGDSINIFLYIYKTTSGVGYRSIHSIEGSLEKSTKLYIRWRPTSSSSSSSSSSLSMSSSSSSRSSSSRSSSSMSATPESDIFKPAANADDGACRAGTTWNDGAQLAFGRTATQIWNAFIRFPNVTIPAGATIVSAHVQGRAYSSRSETTCNINLYFEAADNPAAPTTCGQYNGRTMTSAVDWSSIGSQTADSDYDTPDITSILQEVIDRGGWASGQAVIVYLKDNGSSVGAYRDFSAYNDADPEPELHVSWIP